MKVIKRRKMHTLRAEREPNFIVTVDAIVKCRDEVLLIRRSKFPFTDKLALPGGHVEKSDRSLRAACVRELEEETGIKVRPEQLRLRCVLDSKGRDPRYENSVSVVFQVDLNSWPLDMIAKAGEVEDLVIRNVNSLASEQMAFDHAKAVELLIEWRTDND